ncbi:unnamed protein product [Parajaminaea phylloscopi]
MSPIDLFSTLGSNLPAMIASLYSVYYFLAPLALSLLCMAFVAPHRAVCADIVQIAPENRVRRAHYKRTQRAEEKTRSELEERSCLFPLQDLKRKAYTFGSPLIWIAGWILLIRTYGATCGAGMPPVVAALCALYCGIAHLVAGAHAGLSMYEAENFLRGGYMAVR